MSGFDAGWLNLRESADAAARDMSLLDRLPLPSVKPFRVLDLGAGAGSNLRYLGPRLSGPQEWTLVDDDAALLSAVVAPAQRAPLQVRTLNSNLAHELPRLDACDLVTASAFFDLVSETWLARFAAACADAHVPAGLFALNVDGCIRWWPQDEMDDEIADVFHRHMRRDKGFGPGLGAESADALVRTFADVGYETHIGDSTWHISPAQADMQRALLTFYRLAAAEMAPHRAGSIAEWSARRAKFIDQGASRLMVGHRDVLVLRRLEP